MDLSITGSFPLLCHRHGCRNGAKPGCKRHNAGAKGRDAGSRSRIKPLAPMQVPIGANGWFCCASPPGINVLRPTVFRHPSIFADSRVRNAERSMFIPQEVSRGGENFGGISMDLSMG